MDFNQIVKTILFENDTKTSFKHTDTSAGVGGIVTNSGIYKSAQTGKSAQVFVSPSNKIQTHYSLHHHSFREDGCEDITDSKKTPTKARGTKGQHCFKSGNRFGKTNSKKSSSKSKYKSF